MSLLNLSCRRRFFRFWLAAIALTWLSAISQLAIAQMAAPPFAVPNPGDTFKVTVGTNVTYDSNVFRASELINPVTQLGVSSKSDLIFATSATVGMRKYFGMQRIDAAGIFVDNRYDKNVFLDFFAINYNANWAWRLTPRFHGNAGTFHTEALNNFGNLTGFTSSNLRNIRTSDNHRFDGVYEVTPAWHLLTSVSQQISKNSVAATADFNNQVLSVEGGARYVTPSGGTATYTFRQGYGEFMNRPVPIESSQLDTKFDDMENDLRLVWPVTVDTTVDGRVGYFKRTHAHFSDRNFEGPVGNFNLKWAVTSKTRITTGWSHDLFNSQTAANFLFTQVGSVFSSSYFINEAFYIMPIWQITAKTALRVRYDYTTRHYKGPVAPVPFERIDSQHSAMIALDWQPYEKIFLSAEFRRDHRNSNLQGFGYDVTAGSLIARLNF